MNSSRLVRILSGLAGTDAPESRQSFAERLGQWLDYTHAPSLYSALNAGTAASHGGAAAASESGAAREAFARVHGALAKAVAADAALEPGAAHLEMPAAGPQATVDGAAGFAPYHRCYLAHQRDMSASIAPLRASVRAALSRRSPASKRLAVLDAVLEQALAARERELLATVPAVLAGRFERLHEAHRARLADARTGDDSQRGTQPGGWLAVFRSEMRAVLLAELDLRLQPVAGLIAALDDEATRKQ